MSMFYIINLRSNLRNQLKKGGYLLFGANSFEVLVKSDINDYLTKHNKLVKDKPLKFGSRGVQEEKNI